jgi:hypothetical protein
MNAMLDDDMMGHDARLESVDFDAEKGTAAAHLLAYPETNASKRVPITILFRSVTSLALRADLAVLASNRSAGNVNHWHIAQEGAWHIYLVEGDSSRCAPQLALR